MTRSHVPAYSVTICDCCKKTDKEVGFVQKGKMGITYDVVDWHGVPCAGRDFHYDFCDSCLSVILQTIDKKVDEIRKEKAG